jgi:hypothetical protein
MDFLKDIYPGNKLWEPRFIAGIRGWLIAGIRGWLIAGILTSHVILVTSNDYNARKLEEF